MEGEWRAAHSVHARVTAPLSSYTGRGRSGACDILCWSSTTRTTEVCPSPDEPSACEELKLDRLTSF